MTDRDDGTQAPDYHNRPVLAARVDPEIKAWVYEEAPRRGLTIGDFLDDVLAAERDRGAAKVPAASPEGNLMMSTDTGTTTMVRVTDLFVRCSYPLRPDVLAASDTIHDDIAKHIEDLNDTDLAYLA